MVKSARSRTLRSGSVAWAPEELPIPPDELPAWSYVVLEEIVDDVVLLRRWDWPVVDHLGRLLWLDGAENDTQAAAVDAWLLQSQLYAPNGIERRQRCGDVFAARIGASTKWCSDQHCSDVRELMPSPVYDISAVAREAVKIAYQSSLGAIQTMESADSASRVSVHTRARQRRAHPLPMLRVASKPQPKMPDETSRRER